MAIWEIVAIFETRLLGTLTIREERYDEKDSEFVVCTELLSEGRYRDRNV